MVCAPGVGAERLCAYPFLAVSVALFVARLVCCLLYIAKCEIGSEIFGRGGGRGGQKKVAKIKN